MWDLIITVVLAIPGIVWTIENHTPVLYLEPKSFSLDYLTSNIPEKFDDYRKIHKIRIMYNVTDFNLFGSIIDQYIAARPWWLIEVEPYAWKKDIKHISFVRYSKEHDLLGELKEIANVQYPSDCQKHPLLLYNKDEFHEWGNELYNLENNCMRDNSIILVPYFVDPGCVNVHFVDKNNCPTNMNNKWLAAFLPTTNCSLPKSITDCGQRSCLPKVETFSSSDIDGIMITNDTYWRLDLLPSRTIPYPRSKSLPYVEYCGQLSMGNTIINRTISRGSRQVLMTFGGILFRPNYKYRAMIAKVIHDFTIETSFPKHSNCVAIHIRRTDRAVSGPEGRNMTAWCIANIGKLSWYDMACDLDIPFSRLNLGHYLNASAAISQGTTKNVFLMTDDGPSLKSEIELHNKKHWNIYMLSAPPKHRDVGVENAVNLLASFEIAKQCSYLVGHTRSAITNALHKFMCFKHGRVMGVCPPMYDFGRVQW